MLKTGILLVFLGAGSIVALGQQPTSARNEKRTSVWKQPPSARALTIDKERTVSEAERLTRAGNNRWLAGDFAGAIQAFRKASEHEPKLYAAQYNLAVAYLSQGNYRLALDPLKRLLMGNPKSFELLQYLGRAYYEVKDFQNALKCFEQSAKLASRSSVAPNNLGYAHLSLYQIGAAEEAFKKALEITPGYEPAIMGLCFAYGLARNGALVNEFCTKARQLSPTHSAPNYFLGLAKFNSGEYAEALAFFLRSRTLEPEAASTYVALGFTQHRLRNFKEALANFTRAMELESSESAINGKGVSYVSLKKYNEAEECFRQALAVTPNSFQTRFNLGMVCLIREKRDCALQQYNFLKMFDPPLADRLFEKIVAGRVLDVRAGREPGNSPRE